MACIEKIYSVSAVIPGNKCNANCSFCSGSSLRDNRISKMPETYKSAIKLSARYGGWSLSLTSGGEPTCTPEGITNALEVYSECAQQGAYFPNVNLFTNGILLGDDKFCEMWLPLWKRLGLTAIAVSIHEIYYLDQAKVYGVAKYPDYKVIFDNIKRYGLQPRATIILRKGAIDNPEAYLNCVERLQFDGCENISSWTCGNQDGSRNKYTPSRWNMFKINMWLRKNTTPVIKHPWGGGVFNYDGVLLRLTDYVTKHNPRKNFVRQLVVFPNGDVHYSWIKENSLCWRG